MANTVWTILAIKHASGRQLEISLFESLKLHEAASIGLNTVQTTVACPGGAQSARAPP